jgi:ribose transport system permease protein
MNLLEIITGPKEGKVADPTIAKIRSRLNSLGVFFIVCILWISLGIATDTFATTGNITNVLRQSSLWSIIAIGQTVVLITAGIDLSIGSVVGLASCIVAIMLNKGYPISVSCIFTCLCGLGVGAVHAFGITKGKLPPFIMTLAGLTTWFGVGLLITGAMPIGNLPADFKAFSRGDVLGIPNLFLCVIAVMIPTYIILNHTRLGNHLYAIGSNRPGAELNAVPVTRTIYFAYMYSSFLASIVGILVAARLSLGIASNGFTWELQAVASSVIGGTSLFGAVGNVFGPVLGATIISTINNGANLLNVQPYWQRILTGVIIVAVVFFDQIKNKGK